jgi:LacI family transcriptional regulator
VQQVVTIKDVARRAGVSPAVVSRVLNADTGPVAAGTRQRVLDAIKELRYRPNIGARELKTRTANTVGLVLADVSNHFFAQLADCVVARARELGWGVLLMTTQEDAGLERRSVELLMEKRVRGVIAAPTGGNAASWRQLRDMGIDLVFVDRSVPRVAAADVVHVDDEDGAHTATRHLIGQGHQRIALLAGPPDTSTGRARTQGYRTAVAELGARDDPELVLQVDFRDDATAICRRLLSLRPAPTGLVLANTAMSEGVMSRLREAGVDVPGQLSVVVFHDAPWTRLMTPGVTVVRHPVPELAQHAVDLLVQRLASTRPLRRREVALPSELVLRGSVRDIAAEGDRHGPAADPSAIGRDGASRGPS